MCEAFFPTDVRHLIVLGVLFMLVSSFRFLYSAVVAVGTSPVNMQESSFYYFYLVAAANLKQIKL